MKEKKHNVGIKLEKVKDIVAKPKNVVVNVIDKNGNGEVDIEDVIIMGLTVPGIRINRDEFLRKELFKEFPEETVQSAIKTNPMKAGIPHE